jgi:pimeloyl-ACP methyl ester carboxylesterase
MGREPTPGSIMAEILFTASGVRLRRRSVRPGALNWLLLPGGPGIGSESLEELAAAIEVPGTTWLVDLPGDGSNRAPPGAPADPYSVWPGVLAEAAQALPDAVFVGHSTGGMYLLATLALDGHVRGLALLDTAPDASWHPRFTAMASQHPLPAVDAATARYARDRRDENIAAIAVASAPWNFTPAGLAAGRALLARMPYNGAAIDWSDAQFDHVYRAAWWPASVPVLVMAGSEDRIVWQGGWDDSAFRTPNALFRKVPAAGHFPWIENPSAVRDAFAELAMRIGRAAA